jgi:hypothetical protein
LQSLTSDIFIAEHAKFQRKNRERGRRVEEKSAEASHPSRISSGGEAAPANACYGTIITQQGHAVQSMIQRPHRWRLSHTQAFDCINEFVAFATSEREFNQ